ncbi:TolC family protein [Puniceicoccus vermicola]|uniref:TolC family protein n=2 Tax=Puniceicoccus vermicola TaxID=388746 RepID=A0A7X1B3G6_9BACT|nr:TolC family protein [Puniceicoccus vermicola]
MRTRLTPALLLLASALLASAESPAKPELLELSDYLNEAMASNPRLEALEQRYEAGMQRIPQSGALPDPMFQITHFIESVQTRTGPQENVFVLSQKLPWFGKRGSQKSAASAEAEVLWYSLQNQQLVLAREVSLAFFEYTYTREAIDLTRENRDLLQKLEPIVEEKVRAGADLNALLRLKVEIGKVDDRLQTLQQKKVAQSAELGRLLGLPTTSILPDPKWEAPAPTTYDPSSIAAAIRANNPELQMMQRQIDSAEARSEIARLANYPDITLGLNYIQTGDPVVNPTTPDAGQDPWGFTVAVNVPLWFGKYNASKAEALASRRSLESEYTNRMNDLQAKLLTSLSSLNNANRQLNLYGNELLGLAEQAVENSRAGYRSGRTGILEVIDSERSLLDLQLLYWRAVADAWKQRVIIQTLANQPLSSEFSKSPSYE